MSEIEKCVEQILYVVANFFNHYPDMVSIIDENQFYYLDFQLFQRNATKLSTSKDLPNSPFIVKYSKDQNNRLMVVSWVNMKCFRLNNEQIPADCFIYNMLFNNPSNYGFVPGAIEYSFIAIILNEILKTKTQKDN